MEQTFRRILGAAPRGDPEVTRAGQAHNARMNPRILPETSAPRPAARPIVSSRTLPGLALCAAAALLLAACGGGGGGGGTPTPPGGWLDANAYSTSALATLGTPNETTASTTGSSTVNGATVNWTATAGHLTAVDTATGNPEASFFHVDYVASGTSASQRPVTFFFNGGPGSASAWLHLGSFAPKRLDTGVPDNTFPRDFPYVANAETLIDTTDLVFVDAVGTGLSEAISPFRNNSFWGTDVDAAVMRDFILRWLSTHQRQASPLYVFGESYGTVRAPIVVRYLETAGVPVTGLVLQSSILDYNSNCGVTAGAVSSVTCTGFIPSYAAVGDWLGLVNPPPADVYAFLDQVTAFADGTYEPEDQAWLANGTVPPDSTLATLQADTGLPASNWRAHFNMDSDTFRHQILPGYVAGLYDGRIVAANGSALAADDEPSDTLITGPFSSSIGTVLASIGYTNPSTYVMLSDAISGWNFTHDNGSTVDALPDVIPDLATALTLDPNLRVLSLNGMHDLITPFHQTQLDLARLPTSVSARVAFGLYPGGHMTYLDDAGRVGERAELQAFYDGTLVMGAKATASTLAKTTAATSAAMRQAALAKAPAATTSKAATLDGRPAMRALAVQAPQGAHRDPGLPSAQALQAARRGPGLSGTALQQAVQARLKAEFDRADVAHRGRLTLAEARAAGLGAVAGHFQEIDAAGRGSVSFDDWMRHLQAR